MIRKTMASLALATCAGLLMTSSAMAQHVPTYTFNLPIELSDLHPDVTSILFSCGIFGDPAIHHRNGSFLGGATNRLQITEPNYQGQLTLIATRSDLHLDETPHRWE